ncbi:MAG: BMP family ABC transporter substrate-binding protein [Clostridia bacterium]|nr:BMP family ABC transporter substrate-binding protein [Clostridia bacterium]
MTDAGQLLDGGFNQGTWEGVKAFAESNGKTYKYYQPGDGLDTTDDDRCEAMRLAIQNGAKVIVAPGFLQETAMRTVAQEHPEVKFIFVDGKSLGLDNVTAIVYKEQESGFLAGYAAVKDGYRQLGGTFGGGGADHACNRFAYGFVQGVIAAAGNSEVSIKISFKYGESFSASTQLKDQITTWYNTGTQVVFACGGAMYNSVQDAAESTQNGKIIGVDIDQANDSPRVITSAIKGLGESVQFVLKELYDGKWDSILANETSVLGAAENATGLPTADGSWRFTTFTKEQYFTTFNQIKTGELEVLSIDLANCNDAAWWDTQVAELNKKFGSHVVVTIESADIVG